MTPEVGFLVALAFDVILPFILLVVLGVTNFRHRSSVRREAIAWTITALVISIGVLGAVPAISRTFQYDGGGAVLEVLVTLPLSLIPTLFNSNVVHLFFNQVEWAEFGYFTVIPAFLFGLPLWSALFPLTIRRMLQLPRLAREADLRAIQ